MIYIKESISENNLAIIRVDGGLDIASVPVLEKVCQRNIDRNHRVHLNIGGLYHISREGKDFLKRMKDKVTLEEIPGYIRIED